MVISDNKVIIDSQRIPLQPPSFWEDQAKMRVVAVVLSVFALLAITFAAVLLAHTALGIHLFGWSATALIVTGIGSALAGIAAVACAVWLLRAEYWEDQNFVDHHAKLAYQMPIHQIIETYGWERMETQYLISNAALKRKFFEETENWTYAQILEKFETIITRSTFIQWRDLHNIVKKESQELSFKEFKQRFGDHPVRKGVITTEDSWYKQLVLTSLPDSYEAICKEFAVEISKSLLTPEEITRALEATLVKFSFSAFATRQGGVHKVWELFNKGVMSPASVAPKVLEEIDHENLTIPTILQRYGWEVLKYQLVSREFFKGKLSKELEGVSWPKIFAQYGWKLLEEGFISGKDYRLQCLEEIKEGKWSDIFARYGWRLLDYELATVADLRPYVVKEVAEISSLEQFLAKYTKGKLVTFFTKGLLLKTDECIKQKMLTYFQKVSFYSIPEQYIDVLQCCNMSTSVAWAVSERKGIEADYSSRLRVINSTHASTISEATQKADRIIGDERRKLKQAESALRQENRDHSKRITTFEEELANEVSRHDDVIRNANKLLEIIGPDFPKADCFSTPELKRYQRVLQATLSDYQSRYEQARKRHREIGQEEAVRHEREVQRIYTEKQAETSRHRLKRVALENSQRELTSELASVEYREKASLQTAVSLANDLQAKEIENSHTLSEQRRKELNQQFLSRVQAEFATAT